MLKIDYVKQRLYYVNCWVYHYLSVWWSEIIVKFFPVNCEIIMVKRSLFDLFPVYNLQCLSCMFQLIDVKGG